MTGGLQNRRGGGQQAVLAGCGRKFRESRSEHETTVLVAQNETVTFQRDRKTMRGRTSQTGRGNQLSECGWAGFKSVENLDCLVEHADPGMNFVALRGGCVIAVCLVRGVHGLRFGHGVARIRRRSHTLNYAISHIEMQNVCGSRLG